MRALDIAPKNIGLGSRSLTWGKGTHKKAIMDFANFEEFWKALGRLYDDILEMKESIKEDRESIRENRQSIKELGESVKDLSEATRRLLSAAEKHQLVVESHERRLDRTEITVEAILEDLRRHREGHSPQ